VAFTIITILSFSWRNASSTVYTAECDDQRSKVATSSPFPPLFVYTFVSVLSVITEYDLAPFNSPDVNFSVCAELSTHSRVKLLILTISSTYTPLTVSVPFKRVEYATETQFSILLYLLKYKFPTNHSFAYFLRYS
jgi:hypothetical protein